MSYGSIGYPTSAYVEPVYVEAPPVVEAPLEVDAGVAVGAPPAAEPTLVDLGLSAFAAGDYHEARRVVMRAVLADEQNPFALVVYGLADYALGRYRAAASSIRRGITADPSLIDAPPDLEAIYGRHDDIERHRTSLESYLAGRADADAHLLLGFVYYAGGKPDLAAEQFERAIQIDPSDTVSWLLRDASSSVVPAQPPAEPGPIQP